MTTTEPLFRRDAYLKEAKGRVLTLTEEGGIVLDQSLFYATSGGQPGDSGWLEWPGGRLDIATAVKGQGGAIVLLPAHPGALPPPGTALLQRLDWGRRYRHMRVHTALHLLSVAVPLPVTGGQIGIDKGRLDFDMSGASVDAEALEAEMNRLVALNLPVSEDWITDAELAANPGLVKTMSVAPPTGQGRVRLVRIGKGAGQIDLQPCGGTHVARTGEIGPLTVGKIENKGKQNRRITLHLGNG
ncbi:MAG: alanyl-tRNA editing protein [Paracoccaceae bacterium]